MNKLFTKRELIYVITILFVIFSATLINYNGAQRRARDAQRKQDVRDIYDALENYHTSTGSYPVAEDGKIVICDTGAKNKAGSPVFRKCEWGEKSFIIRLSGDPMTNKGFSYYYVSDTKYFQLYASLEGKQEAEYDRKIALRNLPCGTKICNFGLAAPRVPLDKSLEEYQNEINAKNTAR
ncbi:MAG: type II secretion system protein GspG [Patescibacteria group bacterium]